MNRQREYSSFWLLKIFGPIDYWLQRCNIAGFGKSLTARNSLRPLLRHGCRNVRTFNNSANLASVISGVISNFQYVFARYSFIPSFPLSGNSAGNSHSCPADHRPPKGFGNRVALMSKSPFPINIIDLDKVAKQQNGYLPIIWKRCDGNTPLFLVGKQSYILLIKDIRNPF